MAKLAPLEIQALARIVDELDYYQLLHVDPNAGARDIKTAYYSTSRSFHPDANRSLSRELQDYCNRISKRVTEAYCVLRDPRKRQAYDVRLAAGDGVRIQLAEAKSAHAQSADNQDRTGRTPQGKQFLHRAEDDMKRGDYAAAVRNLQMAMTFEPDNGYFKERLAEAKIKQKG